MAVRAFFGELPAIATGESAGLLGRHPAWMSSGPSLPAPGIWTTVNGEHQNLIARFPKVEGIGKAPHHVLDWSTSAGL